MSNKSPEAAPTLTASPAAAVKPPVEKPEPPAAISEAPAPTENSPKTIPKQEQTNDSADKTAANATPAGDQPTSNNPPSTATDIDWDKVIALAKEQSFAIATLLQHCSWQRNGNTLTLYVGNAFNKKKLDDAKNRPLIATIVQQVTGTELDIATIGQKAPPKDAELAKIAELMGGGEEVNLEELS